MGYIGIYNTIDEDFIIGKVKRSGLNLEMTKLSQWYSPHFEKWIENTEYLGEIIPAKRFLVIGYIYNCENEPESFLVELISKYKKKRYCIDIFLDEEKITYHEGYKITHRFGGGCDYSIIPDPHLSHLCDRLVIISNLTFTEPSPNCNIF